MTRNQAIALSNALLQRQMPHSIGVTFPASGGDVWTINLDPGFIYSGTQLAALANYCETNALTLSMRVQAIGIV